LMVRREMESDMANFLADDELGFRQLFGTYDFNPFSLFLFSIIPPRTAAIAWSISCTFNGDCVGLMRNENSYIIGIQYFGRPSF